jgi:hypothetical protein
MINNSAGADATMDEEENEAEETINMVDVDTSATTGKRKATAPGGRGTKWKSLEDECLIDACKAMRLDPIADKNQTFGKYYKRILDQFNDRLITPRSI